jgi:hypothetical protein
MIEQEFIYYVIGFCVIVVLLLSTFSFPFIGFSRKRWKGMALGCVIQPVTCAVIVFMTITCIGLLEECSLKKHRSNTMVTLRKVSPEGTQNWYLNGPKEECFFEFEQSDSAKKEEKKHWTERSQLFDIVPMDSTSVCVDDRIIVKFDTIKHQVTATDFDEPIEVVNVDWDRVKWYWTKTVPQE